MAGEKKLLCRGERRQMWPLDWASSPAAGPRRGRRVPADQQQVQGVCALVRRHASLPGGGSRTPMPRSSKNGSTARLHPEPRTAWRGAASFLPSYTRVAGAREGPDEGWAGKRLFGHMHDASHLHSIL